MRIRNCTLLVRYGFAAFSIALATWIRLLLDPVLGNQFPYATVFFAVLLTSWYGGFGPALAAVILGALSSAYFLIPPRGAFAIEGWDQQAGMVLYLTTSLGIALLGGAMRVAQQRAERAKEAERRQREQLHITLKSIGDAVLTTDAQGRVTSLNPVAESLTGWTNAEATGKALEGVFAIVNEATRQPVENPATRALREGTIVGLANHTVLIARDGAERPIDDSAAPIRSGEGEIIGVVLVFRDVTERRRLERMQRDLQGQLERQVQERTAELRATEERFRLLVEGTRDYAIFMLDPEGRVITWNPGAERIMGYRADEIIGQHFSRFYPPEAVERGWPAEELRRAGAEGRFEDEGLRVRKDGSSYWSNVIITALHDEAGKLRGFSKITRDLTERKRAEEAIRQTNVELERRVEERTAALHNEREWLRQSEARKTAILETALDAIITIDHEGKVVEFNPAAERVFGYPRAEVLGREMAQLIVPPPLRERHYRGLAHYLATGEGPVLDKRIEMTALRAGGTEFPVELAITRISAEGPPLFTAYVRDITERKRGEQASRLLAEASKSLAALVDYGSTMQKVARLAVPSFADWCAVDMVEADGSLRRVAVAHVDPSKVELAHELNRRHPPDPDAPQGVPHIVRTGKPELISEITDTLLVETVKDEELLRIMRELGLKSYLGVPLQSRGKTVGAITFVAAESGRRFDATDLAVAEDLAHRAGIALENARLYTEVREADHRKDEFLAMLAHELRNPLAPIRNALHIMKQTGADAAVLERVREMMERQVQHMTRMVDDLLDVSRITRGKIELRKEVVDLASVVERTVEAAGPLIEDRRQELTVELPPEPVRLEADPTRLEQVLANLLNNAAKYTDHGGHIWLSARQEGGELVLRVRDTGVGIAPDLLGRIFEPFVQADRVLHQSQGGLGIGLTLVRRLVEMHGGSVTVSSAGPGKGSEFTVRLPALSPAQSKRGAPAAGERSEPVGAAPQRRILVVDDNVDAAESLAMLLRMAGHDVRVAHDGPAALTAVEADPPGLVFLDIGMPVMNGYDVAQRLRQQPGLKNLVLVAMTGWGQEEDRRRSKEAGFDHHLVKPADPDALQQLLAGERVRST
jgi:PAS domain S-box-containing protein